MSIVFSRIDDRLIHGQVVTSWVTKLGIEQIIVVDNMVANDKMQKSILRMTAPSGINMAILSEDKFISTVKNQVITKQTMLIFRDPIAVFNVIKGGVELKELNIGGMRKIDNRTIKISKAVYFNEDECKAVKELLDVGVNISIQMVPQDKEELLKAEMIK